MNRIADRAGRTGVDPRMMLMLALTVVVGLPAVLQRTEMALLSHGADDFLEWAGRGTRGEHRHRLAPEPRVT